MVLYEKDSTCGGHTLTDTTSEFPVDLGFQVCVQLGLAARVHSNCWMMSQLCDCFVISISGCSSHLSSCGHHP